MMKASGMNRRRWFRHVNQRLAEMSVMLRMNKGHRMISKTAKREEQKFPIARRAMR